MLYVAAPVSTSTLHWNDNTNVHSRCIAFPISYNPCPPHFWKEGTYPPQFLRFAAPEGVKWVHSWVCGPPGPAPRSCHHRTIGPTSSWQALCQSLNYNTLDTAKQCEFIHRSSFSHRQAATQHVFPVNLSTPPAMQSAGRATVGPSTSLLPLYCSYSWPQPHRRVLEYTDPRTAEQERIPVASVLRIQSQLPSLVVNPITYKPSYSCNTSYNRHIVTMNHGSCCPYNLCTGRLCLTVHCKCAWW